jgi:hypothetical protein
MLVFDCRSAIGVGKGRDFDAEGGGADAVLTEAIVRIRVVLGIVVTRRM